ncbi:glutamate--cysteine ligase [Halorientalis halophila]|uniref:glutamate--cysteine ligase n=1 Tax=Halorientalis halophila TaxID=3108499 RepID=UPI00300863E0
MKDRSTGPSEWTIVDDRSESPQSAQPPDTSFTRLGTLGVEEEFYLVDANGRPAHGASRLVHGSLPSELADQIETEVYDCLVETKTDVCDDAAALGRQVRRKRRALRDHAAHFGRDVAAAGIHPAACPDDVQPTEGARYRAMLDRLQYPQWRNLATGLHLHVGVDDAEKAVWIANELRWYLPVFLALSANSPFYDGHDTGLASARANVFGSLPCSGMPPAFDSFAAYRDVRETMIETDAIPDANQLWWDVRLKPDLGTVEIRTADAQFDPDTVVAFAEYARALVRDLAARYEDGESATEFHDALLETNRWRALRYGHDAEFTDRNARTVVDLGTVVSRECDRLGIDGIGDVLDRPSGSARQRTAYDQRGLSGVCDLLRISSAEEPVERVA